MNKKKTATMVASLALVGAIGVGATLAYLSSTSNLLTNTFTIGQGYNPVGPTGQAAWIDEYDIDQTSLNGNDYILDDEVRTLKGNEYKDVYPGSELKKDPILRLANNSVTSYGYIKVSGITSNHNITINRNDWTPVGEVDAYGNGIYRYNNKLTSGESNIDSDGDKKPDLDLSKIASTSSLFAADEKGNTIHIRADFSANTLDEIKLSGCVVQAVTNVNGSEVDVPTTAADTQATSQLQNQ